MFLFSYLSGAFATLCFVFAAGLLYLKRKHVLTHYLALLVVGAGVWALSNSLADFATTRETVIFWSGIAVVSFCFLTSFFLSFIFVFVHGQKTMSWRRIACYYLPTISLSLFAFSPLSIQEVYVLPGVPSQIAVGPLYIVGPLFLYAAFFFVFTTLVRHYRRFSRRQQFQALYVTLGAFSTLLGLTVFDIVLPLFGELRFFSVGPISTVFLLGAISYAILRHKLMDVRIVIQRGVIYTAVLVFIVGVYLATVFSLGAVFQSATQTTALISALFTTFVGIFGVPPIERYFRRVTDRIFFKDRYNYPETLHGLSRIVAQHIDLRTLIDEISRALKMHLRVADVRFVPVLAPAEALGGLAIPVALEGKQKGTLLMGEKLSGDAYSSEDVRLLNTFSYHLAVALEKAELYERLKDYAVDLEKKVEERTREIKELQEEQKRTILDISHGLQTPLAVIKNELGLLSGQMPGEKIEVVGKSIDGISKFVYDLLSLARLDALQASLEKTSVNISELVKELAEYFSVLAKEKSIILNTAIEEGIVVQGAAKRLEELVVNLTSNAMKYLKEGGEKKVFLSLRRVGEAVELVVKDNGMGIDAKDLPHIFDRFYRAGENKTGSGLGLAIAKQIVEKHGGAISVESDLGRGTTFTVRF